MTHARTFMWIVISMTLMTLPLVGYDDAPRCFQDLQQDFFNPVYVEQALSNQGVPQNVWRMIVRDLNNRSRDVSRMLRDRAREVKPNPLRKPFNSEVAERMLDEILYDIFYDTLRKYDVYNQFRADEMFDFIKLRQRDQWGRCFAK